LRAQADRVDEGHEDDEDYQSAEDEAHESATRVFRELSAEERTLLDRLSAWAEHARERADAKASALIDLIEQTCRADGAWTHERLIVFTEYRDTQRSLLDLLADLLRLLPEKVSEMGEGPS